MENTIKEEEKEDSSSPSKHEKHDDTEMEKAVRFWTHPSLTCVSAEEKKQYLVSRGLSQDEIHKVWERIAEQETSDSSGDGAVHQQQAPSNTTPTAAPPSNTPHEYPPPPQQGAASPPPHYPQQPQYNSSYMDQQQYGGYNNNNTTSDSAAMDVPALLGIGAALGVTAAAAIRWLNGGDFCLLPPPTRKEQTTGSEESNVVAGQVRAVEEDEQDDDENQVAQEDDGVDDDYIKANDESQQPPSQDMQQILKLLETHTEKQNAILQQISNFTTKKVTDQSMQLLRQCKNRSNNDESIHKELEEIKVTLQSLSKSDSTTNAAWERQLEECLTQLQECMKQLSSSSSEEASTCGTSNGASQVDSNISSQAIMDSLSATTPQATVPTEQAAETSKSLLLRQAIQRLAQENEPVPLRAGAQLLYLYVINLSSHPHVPRYRKIFTTNESFSMVQQLQGGTDLLVAVGFEEKGNCFEWQGGSEDSDTLYLKEAAAALSILKSCSSDDASQQVATNALSVLRPSTPPPASAPASALQTPVFIASPPTTKKHPLLDESGEGDSLLDISNASEHFEQRLESLAQPVMDDMRMFDAPLNGAPKASLSMRESEESDSEQDGSGNGVVESKAFNNAETNGEPRADDELGGKED